MVGRWDTVRHTFCPPCQTPSNAAGCPALRGKPSGAPGSGACPHPSTANTTALDCMRRCGRDPWMVRKDVPPRPSQLPQGMPVFDFLILCQFLRVVESYWPILRPIESYQHLSMGEEGGWAHLPPVCYVVARGLRHGPLSQTSCSCIGEKNTQMDLL